MFYLISFILIILFIVETWKSTKALQYYKNYYETINNNNNNNNINNSNNINISKTNNNVKESLINTSQDYKNSNHFKKDSIFRHGFLPSNYAESSNYSLEGINYSTDNPNMSKDEIKQLQETKFATSYPSEMTYNPGYFNPEKEKYIRDRRKIPLKWKCQREWYENCS